MYIGEGLLVGILQVMAQDQNPARSLMLMPWPVSISFMDQATSGMANLYAMRSGGSSTMCKAMGGYVSSCGVFIPLSKGPKLLERSSSWREAATLCGAG